MDFWHAIVQGVSPLFGLGGIALFGPPEMRAVATYPFAGAPGAYVNATPDQRQAVNRAAGDAAGAVLPSLAPLLILAAIFLLKDDL